MLLTEAVIDGLVVKEAVSEGVPLREGVALGELVKEGVIEGEGDSSDKSRLRPKFGSSDSSVRSPVNAT